MEFSSGKHFFLCLSNSGGGEGGVGGWVEWSGWSGGVWVGGRGSAYQHLIGQTCQYKPLFNG